MRAAFSLFSLAIAYFAGLAQVPAATNEADKLIVAARAPARFASHKPDFSWGEETFTFKNGSKQTFFVIKDGAAYAAVLDAKMNQLDMITFNPEKTPPRPPFQEYYSWGKLLGSRITTAAWYPEMSASGKVTTKFSGGGKTLQLSVVQTWSGENTGASTYSAVLRCDPVVGYLWDIATDLSMAKPLTNTKGERIRPELLNWQVKVTHMGRRHNQPWPDQWDHQRTVFHCKDDKLVGFYLNAEAIDRSRFKRSEVKEGGYVAKLPGPDGWGTAVVHLEKGRYSTNNATCNMWADQHNLLKFAEKPEADGNFRVAAKWRFQAIPPEAVQVILEKAEWDTMGVK